MKYKELFETGIKRCTSCNCDLPEGYEGEICPRCKEAELFEQVKEYIRSNDVTEWDVAEKFGIQRRKVRNWISQGRIEYQDDGTQHFGKIYERCSVWGNPVLLGAEYPNCAKKFKR